MEVKVRVWFFHCQFLVLLVLLQRYRYLLVYVHTLRYCMEQCGVRWQVHVGVQE